MKRENQPFLVNLRQNSSLFDIRSGKMDDSIHPLSSTTVHKRTVYPANGITNPFILYPPAIYFPIETERNARKFIPATLSTRERTQRFRRQQKKMIAEAVVSFHGRIRQMAMMKLPRLQSRLLTSRPRILILPYTLCPSSDTLRFATGCPVVPTANDGSSSSSSFPLPPSGRRKLFFRFRISGKARFKFKSSIYEIWCIERCGSPFQRRTKGKPFRLMNCIYIHTLFV